MQTSKVNLIDQKIKDNVDILLSSFGIQGLLKSQLKFRKIEEIINSLSGEMVNNIDLFYDELREYYYSDKQFKDFRTYQIEKFISDERNYVMARLLKF